MKTLKSPIRLSMLIFCSLVVLLKFNSLDYRTASVIVIDSNSTNQASTVKIISGDHFDEGLLLNVEKKLNVNDTLFVQYNHFYDVTWISTGFKYAE